MIYDNYVHTELDKNSIQLKIVYEQAKNCKLKFYFFFNNYSYLYGYRYIIIIDTILSFRQKRVKIIYMYTITKLHLRKITFIEI